MEWRWKKYSDLTVDEFHDAIFLREQVFVVEQNCAYQDVDGLDRAAWHLLGYVDGKLCAYLRVLPQNTRFADVSFGRVVTSPHTRRAGYGRLLTAEALRRIHENFGEAPVRISAQAYLEKFYGGFGFSSTGKTYLEDGIPHVEMLRNAKP